jgi:hypothetical protein
MAKVKIEGNASGTGTFTIAAPNSNTDRVLTLPDAAGELLTTTGDGSGLTGVGITEADVWGVSSPFTFTTETFLTSNLVRYTNNGMGYKGTGMSQSSGIFSFPSIGYWFIQYRVGSAVGGSATDYVGAKLYTTTDDSSYSIVVDNYSDSNANGYSDIVTSIIFDVTNISTHKCKFSVQSQASTVLETSSTRPRTSMTFIRLGDT